MPGWGTPYGTVSRAGSYSEWRRRMAAQRPALTYSQPGVTVDRNQYPGWYPSPWQVPVAEAARRMVDEPLTEYWGLPPTAAVGGGAPPISATMPLGTRTAQAETSWATPGGTPVLPTSAAPVGPWSPGLMTPGAGGTYPGMRPPALGAYPAGLGTPYPTPATAPSDAYLPLRMKGPWPSGAPTPTAPTGGGGGGAPAGTPTTTGAFGPFGSIEDWRNQFYSEHGRWPTDTDAQDAIASFGFLGQTGRPPTQKEWEDRWHGGYGGTTQWGPMGGGMGYGGGYGQGGWSPPPEPSWWGGNVWGDEGWAYLPTGPGKYPYPKPERTEGAADWYNIKDIQTFQQVDPQWRDWLQQAMQSQQQHWEDPLMAPIQWMQPAQSEL